MECLLCSRYCAEHFIYIILLNLQNSFMDYYYSHQDVIPEWIHPKTMSLHIRWSVLPHKSSGSSKQGDQCGWRKPSWKRDSWRVSVVGGDGEGGRKGSDVTHRQRREWAQGTLGSRSQPAADAACTDMSAWDLVVTGDSTLKLGYGRTSSNNAFRNLGWRR